LGSPEKGTTRPTYGAVEESKRAIRAAVDRGITFFDTADDYGIGGSERLLGEALQGIRQKVVISTKFGGGLTDEEMGEWVEGTEVTPEYVEQSCEASLQRLGTDVIDVYLLHIRDYPVDRAEPIRDAVEDLAAKGKILSYGWSTDDPERAKFFAQGKHCAAVEHRLNVLMDARKMLDLCDEEDLRASIAFCF